MVLSVIKLLNEGKSTGQKMVRHCGFIINVFGFLQTRQTVLNAATQIGKISQDIMQHVEPDTDADVQFKVC